MQFVTGVGTASLSLFSPRGKGGPQRFAVTVRGGPQGPPDALDESQPVPLHF